MVADMRYTSDRHEVIGMLTNRECCLLVSCNEHATNGRVLGPYSSGRKVSTQAADANGWLRYYFD